LRDKLDIFTFNYPSRPPSAIRAMNADLVDPEEAPLGFG
jgi:hypothetical protein